MGTPSVTLAEALRGVSRIGIDSSAFIDYAEAHPRSVAVLSQVFSRIEDGTLAGITTVLTLTEVLTYARAGNDAQKEKGYRALLGSVHRVPVSEQIALRTADLRGIYALATADALQAATALESDCQAFITSDAGDFMRLSGEIRVIVPSKLMQ